MRIIGREPHAAPRPWGRGETIELDGNELAIAVEMYLLANGVRIHGPRTVRIEGQLARDVNASVYVDPSGRVDVAWNRRHADFQSDGQ